MPFFSRSVSCSTALDSRPHVLQSCFRPSHPERANRVLWHPCFLPIPIRFIPHTLNYFGFRDCPLHVFGQSIFIRVRLARLRSCPPVPLQSIPVRSFFPAKPLPYGPRPSYPLPPHI